MYYVLRGQQGQTKRLVTLLGPHRLCIDFVTPLFFTLLIISFIYFVLSIDIIDKCDTPCHFYYLRCFVFFIWLLLLLTVYVTRRGGYPMFIRPIISCLYLEFAHFIYEIRGSSVFFFPRLFRFAFFFIDGANSQME